jgi:hypothetical protein
MLMLLLGQLHPLLGLFILWLRDHFPLAQMREVVRELLEAAANKVDVLVTLLEKDLSNLSTLTFVAHVDHNELVRGVLKTEEFRDEFVASYVWRRVIKRLFNVAVHVFLWFTHVQEKELGILSNSEHLSRIGYS